MSKPTTESIVTIIENWFATHFHNSKAAQDTEIYNQLHAAKEDLKQQLSHFNQGQSS